MTNEVGVRTMRLKPIAKNTVGGKIFPEFFNYECEETPLEHERIPTHPRQDGAAKSLERYLSIRDEIRSADKKELAEHSGAPPVTLLLFIFT